MKYIKSKIDSSWVGKISDDSNVPEGYIEITEEEYIQIERNRLSFVDVYELCD